MPISSRNVRPGPGRSGAGPSGYAHALGMLAGVALDALLADPRRGHPVALFGRAAAALEKRLYGDARANGAAHVALCVGSAALLGVAAGRVRHPLARGAVSAVATWSVLGGTTLGREGAAMAAFLESGDLAGARGRLPHLCGRDPSHLEEAGLARATVESIAENTSDAVVAPLLWGAVAGVPGLLAYRAVNTLDAMVGHRDARYTRFGWAAARLDDVANAVPARLTGLLTVLAAPVAGGSARRAAAVLRRDGHRHPSPNAGRCEAAFAGALDVTLGGTNVYGSRVEHRPEMGDGRKPEVRDIRRSVRLARAVGFAAAGLAVLVALGVRDRRPA
ncbi:cobalamin biosynthesis protein [Planomonospora venezuelensis]|uniref:Cobalamin biosynthesis protein CobD n=1 Tax=Planomonospora venezuelensis TaxID=1999 RepID=A0A841CVY7_PLAVE|nr:cobalamin biosynthesis protein [Planomonospora venezuelensis]MBB5962552.1 adenosylcobinamide-phosphate synthase [Planomonospora venezuelensis]GIM99042.1 cobalamin biosynthesis protein CobD [Planomonospora venezuelensis]